MSHVWNEGQASGNYFTSYTQTNQIYGGGTGKLLSDELKKAGAGKYRHLMDMLTSKGFKSLKGMDMRARLMMLLEVILAELDDQIFGIMKELQDKSSELKQVSKKQAEDNPGQISGLNTDSSILQAKLTMLVQRRQQFVDSINNALKNIHDSDMNAVRRMV